ncbi:MAG TPA: D-2-hydroxyacid dehydrogenase [Chthonomonadales bacterium]|nr:D-2-hydroxyacid dehydrogenase [Chthonomonadales bacterium]
MSASSAVYVRALLAFSHSAEDRALLAAAAPGVELIDAGDRARWAGLVADCDALFGHPDAALIEAGHRLRWVQVGSAGVDHLPIEAMRQRGIALTSGSGTYGAPIAEHLIGLMLAFAMGLPRLCDLTRRGLWAPSEVRDRRFELAGQTLAILGLGDIGSALARRAAALDMRVLGVRRRPLPPPPGVAEAVPWERRLEMVAEADHVALCLPLTPATDRAFGRDELAAMKPGAYLYNVGRGRSIDRDALIAALRGGRLAGAGLDVTDPEPLPEGDPLWSAPNVILTQHTSGFSANNRRRLLALYAANLGRFARGEPLLNRVDLDERY